MKTLRALLALFLLGLLPLAASESFAATPVKRSAAARVAPKPGPESAKRTKKKCWLIECTGFTALCYAYGDVAGGMYFVEYGRMSRAQVDCPGSTPGGVRHDRIFAYDPDDPTQQAGYGWTNCDAWVNGPSAVVTEYDDTQLQATFTD